MRTASLILIIIYSILMLYSAIKVKTIKFAPKALMIGGGLMLIIFIILDRLDIHLVILLISGLSIIEIGAIINGLNLYKKLNLSHHIIRIAFSIGLILLIIL